MRVLAKSLAGALLLNGAPDGYPLGHPVDGEQQIPRLAKATREQVPESLCAFNDRGRAADATSTGLHFFRDDEALLPILARPAKYAPIFTAYRLVLTPDVTIGDGMPPWQRARAVVMSRMAGVVWQAHGLTVVPTLRWRTKDDYDNVAAGIPEGGVVAVASYGSRRDRESRSEYENGLRKMVQRLVPECVMVFGRTQGRVYADLARRTEFIEYLPPTAQARPVRRSKLTPGQHSLFDAAQLMDPGVPCSAP